MRRPRKTWLVAAAALAAFAVAAARADYNIPVPQTGPTALVRAFVCTISGLQEQCPTHVIIDSSGNEKGIPSNPVATSPYNYTPLSPMQSGLTLSSAQHLTIPSGATYAVVCASVQAVNYSIDGTTVPTSSIGMPLASGSCVPLAGAAVLAAFQAIQQVSGATISASYFR
jgi:hypothetical protein